MKNFARILISALLLVSLQFSMTACAYRQRANSHEDTGLSLQTLQFDGLERSYYLHLPPNDNDGRGSINRGHRSVLDRTQSMQSSPEG